jgi:hypothetical protein
VNEVTAPCSNTGPLPFKRQRPGVPVEMWGQRTDRVILAVLRRVRDRIGDFPQKFPASHRIAYKAPRNDLLEQRVVSEPGYRTVVRYLVSH